MKLQLLLILRLQEEGASGVFLLFGAAASCHWRGDFASGRDERSDGRLQDHLRDFVPRAFSLACGFGYKSTGSEAHSRPVVVMEERGWTPGQVEACQGTRGSYVQDCQLHASSEEIVEVVPQGTRPLGWSRGAIRPQR